MARPSATAATIGYRSAVLATVCSVTYIVGQLAEWAGLFGSRGGPESASTPLGIAILLTPSLFLGGSFVFLTVCVHQVTAPEERVWSQAAIAFATSYATLTGCVYFVQLSLVAPRLLGGRMADIELLRFVPFDSFLYAVDILGYSFMSVSTLCMAMAFTRPGIERLARFWLTVNGLLLPFVALQMYFHGLIVPASLWAITFPASTVTLAVLFRRTAAAADLAVAIYGSAPSLHLDESRPSDRALC